jgi:hypothetical protein
MALRWKYREPRCAASRRKATILKLPLEIFTAIARDVFRDEIIDLKTFASFTYLTDLVRTKKDLSFIASGIIDMKLATRIMM